MALCRWEWGWTCGNFGGASSVCCRLILINFGPQSIGEKRAWLVTFDGFLLAWLETIFTAICQPEVNWTSEKFYIKAIMRSWLDLKQFWWLSVSESRPELIKTFFWIFLYFFLSYFLSHPLQLMKTLTTLRQCETGWSCESFDHNLLVKRGYCMKQFWCLSPLARLETNLMVLCQHEVGWTSKNVTSRCWWEVGSTWNNFDGSLSVRIRLNLRKCWQQKQNGSTWKILMSLCQRESDWI